MDKLRVSMACGMSAFAILGAAAAPALAGSSLKADPGLTCNLVKVKDDEKTGMDAFTYFVPKGWQSKSSFKWNNNSYVCNYSAATPDGLYDVEHVEPFNMTYQSATNTQPVGFHLGSATDFLRLAVAKMVHDGRMSNPKVVEETNQNLPLTTVLQLLQQQRMIGGMSQVVFNQTGFLKVSFERNGVQETADLGCTLAGSDLKNDMKLGFGRTQSSFSSETATYIIGPCLFVLAPIQPDAERVKEAQIVASTARMTPPFLDYCAKLALAMAVANFKATLEQGQRMIQEMRERSEKIMDDYKQKWAAQDDNTRQFCNYLLDKQDYKDADGTVVTAPSGYDHVWESNNGDFVLTNNPSYDPKGDFQDWHQLDKYRPGQ